MKQKNCFHCLELSFWSTMTNEGMGLNLRIEFHPRGTHVHTRTHTHTQQRMGLGSSSSPVSLQPTLSTKWAAIRK